MPEQPIPLVLTGASGRIGRILTALWAVDPPPGFRVITAGRGAGADLHWDMTAGTVALPERAVVLHLAAVLGRDPVALAQNTVMARHLAVAARQSGARAVMFVSTAAVYGRAAHDSVETDDPIPASPYGQAKLAAEMALPGDLPAHILRVANVPGVDALLGAAGGGQVVLDPVPGQAGGPVRSWIGPETLAKVLAALILRGDLPKILNIAQPGPLPMAALLDAAGLDWRYGAGNPAVLPRAVLDVARLGGLMPLAPASAPGLVAEWRRVQKLLA